MNKRYTLEDYIKVFGESEVIKWPDLESGEAASMKPVSMEDIQNAIKDTITEVQTARKKCEANINFDDSMSILEK
jgi:hypothetical protein